MWLAVLLAAIWALDAHADKKTICTITVNSSDEKEVFRRSLSPDKFQFVELVERARPDWLAAACQQRIRCDVLVISGHYDGRDEFYSDREGAVEFLPVEEMERASCSHSCSELFSQLKEVYLFGCNTLNPEALRRASAEIERNLVHSGYSRADAESLSRTLSARHGESSRDRMRLIFRDVPVIYGFSAKAPLGPVAATMLSSYFRSEGASETGSGHASPRLLGHFAGTSLTVASGLNNSDALAGFRRDVCEFSDGGLSPAQKLDFVHRLVGREMAEVRLFLDRIEKYVASVSENERQVPEVAHALAAIVGDRDARNRYLEFARDADQPAIRARMIKLARQLGWLSEEDKRAEFVRLINDRLANNTVGPADVDLICVLGEDGELNEEIDRLQPSPPLANKVGHEAVLACLGSTEARAQVLLALTSPDVQEAQIAQVYLRRRPITNVDEVREVTSSVAQMNDPSAQIRALDTLAGQHFVDPESLEVLAHLFLVARTLGVQTAIAGILIRSDYQAIGTLNLAQELRESSLTAPGRSGPIDILLRRLPGG
jgi:hypothetical protein